LIFSLDIWNEWLNKIENRSSIKKYIHFDHPIEFSNKKEKLKKLFSTPGAISKHSFLPLIKIVTKTPRYKYQDDLERYSLETKERPISFASHFDTLVYGYYAFALGKNYQNQIHSSGFSDSILAYRTDLGGKCNIQFSKEVFEYIRNKGECSAIALDIKGYFDSIDHQILKSMWAKVLGKTLDSDDYAIFKSLTKYSYIKQTTLLKHFDLSVRGKNVRRPTSYSNIIPGKTEAEKLSKVREGNLIVTNKSYREVDGKKFNYGVPQGSSLSALLSNIYLIEFDEYMSCLGKKLNFLYRRYCDDILIVCNTSDALRLKDETIRKIKEEFHLTIQNQKVELIEFKRNSRNKLRGYNLAKLLANNATSYIENNHESSYYKSLQYLGFEFNGQKIFIRNSSLSRYFRKMRARIVKSVGMAYGAKGHSDQVFKKQIFYRYTHLGKRNFLHYAYQASQKSYRVSRGLKEGMDSPAIKKQIARHFDVILKSLSIKNRKRFLHKLKTDEGLKIKSV
jgi:RNA-directed DNA polymerase